ncbi:MAG: hypothetical protein J6O04_06040 [Selenomonadaceae bacterium]|nr:hypothetical protein [Selenomonadaceae bacterium]
MGLRPSGQRQPIALRLRLALLGRFRMGSIDDAKASMLLQNPTRGNAH